MRIPYALRRLALAFGLIAIASAILLLSDSDRRPRLSSRKHLPRIALFQFSANPLLDEFMAGAREALAQHGLSEPNARIRLFNADGDTTVASTIAREVTGGGWDLVLTCTTPCLQAVARANTRGRAMHVFGLVTDPFRSGIGLDAKAPLKHPRHIVGFGSLQPVGDAFDLARAMNPSLARVGVVWNPGEANSEICTLLAREACARLGIRLVEASAESPSAVYEAAASLLAQGVEAIWVGGDNVALGSIGSIVQAGKKGRIPVFTSQSGNVKKGVLFDLGSDQTEIGRLTGDLAARVVTNEVDPASLPIQDLMPKLFLANPAALEGLTGWSLPPEVLAKADGVMEASGLKMKRRASRPLGKTWRIRLIHYSDAPFSEEAQVGIIDELRKSGLVAERDYELTVRSAQGDIATVGALVQAAETERVDLILTTSTPTLQAVSQRIKRIPVVFTVVADPVVAGAGKSFQEHLPNITGIATAGDYGRLVAILKQCLPDARRVGTLFTPSEVNSVRVKEMVEAEAKSRGLTLVPMPVETSSDVANAAQALVAKDLDAVLQIPGNLTAVAFASIAQAASRARLPVFSYISKDARVGSVVTVSRDYEQAGRDAVTLALRVMRGENPATIPFQLVSVSTISVNLATARRLNVTIPDQVRREATELIRE